MSKEHKIASLNDLCNLVSDSNVKVLSEDLKIWLISYHATIDAFRKSHPSQTKGLTNTEIAQGSFTWIDDNENKIKGVTVVTSDGKSTRVDF